MQVTGKLTFQTERPVDGLKFFGEACDFLNST